MSFTNAPIPPQFGMPGRKPTNLLIQNGALIATGLGIGAVQYWLTGFDPKDYLAMLTVGYVVKDNHLTRQSGPMTSGSDPLFDGSNSKKFFGFTTLAIAGLRLADLVNDITGAAAHAAGTANNPAMPGGEANAGFRLADMGNDLIKFRLAKLANDLSGAVIHAFGTANNLAMAAGATAGFVASLPLRKNYGNAAVAVGTLAGGIAGYLGMEGLKDGSFFWPMALATGTMVSVGLTLTAKPFANTFGATGRAVATVLGGVAAGWYQYRFTPPVHPSLIPEALQNLGGSVQVAWKLASTAAVGLAGAALTYIVVRPSAEERKAEGARTLRLRGLLLGGAMVAAVAAATAVGYANRDSIVNFGFGTSARDDNAPSRPACDLPLTPTTSDCTVVVQKAKGATVSTGIRRTDAAPLPTGTVTIEGPVPNDPRQMRVTFGKDGGGQITGIIPLRSLSAAILAR